MVFNVRMYSGESFLSQSWNGMLLKIPVILLCGNVWARLKNLIILMYSSYGCHNILLVSRSVVSRRGFYFTWFWQHKECPLLCVSWCHVIIDFCRKLSERTWRTVWDVPRTPSKWHQDSNRDAIESDASAFVHTGTSACETRWTPQRCAHAHPSCKQHFKISVSWVSWSFFII